MLTERLQKMRDFTQQRKYKQFRTDFNENGTKLLRKLNWDFTQRSAWLLKEMCRAEDPIVFPGEKIGFIRTKNRLPVYCDPKAVRKYVGKNKHLFAEPFHNICPDYAILLNEGLEEKRRQAETRLSGAGKGKNIFKRCHHNHRRGSQPCAKIQSRRRSGRQSDRRRAFRPRTSLPGRRFPRSAAVCPLHFLNFQHGRQLPVRIRPNGPIPLSFL